VGCSTRSTRSQTRLGAERAQSIETRATSAYAKTSVFAATAS
jgi:hypothetical protein